MTKTNEQLFELYAKKKSLQVRNALVEANVPLVAYIVKKYYSNNKMHMERKEDLLQEGIIGLLSAIDGFDLTLGFKFSTYACVPLTTKILTRSGWKSYNEIKDGDETLGYKDGHAEWTKIEGVTTYEDAPLVRFGDGLWNAVCTPQHKWLISENGKVELRPLTEWPNSKKYEWPSRKQDFSGKKIYKRPDTQLITAAPYIGGLSPLTADEASLLAWVLSDGSLIGGRYNPTGATIIQKATNFADEIRELLKRLGAYNSDVKHGDNGCISFTVKAKVFRQIWDKSGLANRSISNLVLDLSREARKAWFRAWEMAEGTKGRKAITQNNGEKLEALELCAFLEGKSGVHRTKKSATSSTVNWHGRNRTPRRCTVIPIGTGKVWCPKTGLGSWTAQTEEGFTFLTGNTWWIRQAVNNYLINVLPIIRVPSHVRTAQNKLLKKLQKENRTLQNLISKSDKSKSIPLDNEEKITHNMLSSIQSAIQSRYVISLDEPMKCGEETRTFEDTLVSDSETAVDVQYDKNYLVRKLSESLSELSEKERYILLLRYDIINPRDITKRDLHVRKI